MTGVNVARCDICGLESKCVSVHGNHFFRKACRPCAEIFKRIFGIITHRVAVDMQAERIFKEAVAEVRAERVRKIVSIQDRLMELYLKECEGDGLSEEEAKEYDKLGEELQKLLWASEVKEDGV